MADHSPWILHHPKTDDLNSATAHSLNFISLTNRRLRRSIDLPSPFFSFVGSGHGWIVLYDSSSCSLALFNPSSKLLRPLPSLLTLSHLRRSPGSDIITIRCDLCRQKGDGVNPKSDPKSLAFNLIGRAIVILNPNSTSSDDDVVVFLSLLHPGMSVVFVKPGDRAWTELDCCDGAADAINHQEKLMSIKFDGTVIAWKLQNFLEVPGSARVRIHRDFYEWRDLAHRAMWVYVNREVTFSYVESPKGELWRVKKEWKKGGELEVKVHKMGDILREVKDLEGCAVFVGAGNAGFCISPEQCPGVRGDCVYFAEQCRDGSRTPIGVYDMKDGSMEPIELDVAMEIYPQPAWFMLP